jgi:hypothetical protein
VVSERKTARVFEKVFDLHHNVKSNSIEERTLTNLDAVHHDIRTHFDAFQNHFP